MTVRSQLLRLCLVTSLLAMGCHGPDGDDDNDDDDDSSADNCEYGVWEGFYEIESVADLEALAGYTEVTGGLSIGYSTASATDLDEVSDLAPLNCLERVGGTLEIGDQDACIGCYKKIDLVSLHGLESLEMVGGLVIECANSLQDISALGNIHTVESDAWTSGVAIAYNAELTNLDGLQGLTTLSGWLSIRANYALQDVDALAGLEHVAGISIGGWTDTLGCDKGVGNIPEGNHSLQHLDGLSGILSIEDDLIIGANENLQDIDGLSLLESVGGEVIIGANGALVDLDGLSGLASIGGQLEIGTFLFEDVSAQEGYGNPSLEDIHGLSGLGELGGDLYVLSNEALPTSEAEWLRDHLIAQGWDGTATLENNLE